MGVVEASVIVHRSYCVETPAVEDGLAKRDAMYHVPLPLKQPEHFNPLTQDYEMTDDENKEKYSDATQKNAFSIFLTLTIFLVLFFAIWDAITQRYTSWPTWSYALCSTTLTSVLLWIAFAAKKSMNPQTLSLYIKKQLNRLPLFVAICLWVTAAVILYTALNWMWGKSGVLSGWTLNGETSGPLERIKSSLVIIGGIGGVGYLVIKYREQSGAERDRARLEENEADKKLADAVQQLGSESPQVRIAGVYALADVADTYGSEKYGVDYNKRVVEILCGYLRTDRHIKVDDATTPNLTENATEALDVEHPRFTCNVSDTMENPKELFKGIEDAGKTATEKKIIQNPVPNSDGPTESAILSVLRDHLRFYPSGSNHPEDSLPGPWSCYHINLDGATIMEPIDFQYTHTSKLSCQRTIFYNEVNFTGAHFQDTTNFRGCTFVSQTSFQSCTFHHDIDFRPTGDRITTFMHDADFRGVEFSGETAFQHTKFTRVVSFAPTVKGDRSVFIKAANFRGAIFENEANFHQVIFRKEADFSPDYTEYNTGLWTQDSDPNNYPTKLVKAIFTRAYFIGCADFEKAKMDELTDFQGALFNKALKETSSDMHFPSTITLTSDDLPEGAKWTEFINDEPALTARRESHQQSESA